MKNPLKTTEGFCVIATVVGEGLKRLWPDIPVIAQIIDGAVYPLLAIAGTRIYKKAITPGLTPFQPQ